VAQSDSYFAAEGTKAHALGELEASLAFGKIDQAEYDRRHPVWEASEPELSDEGLADMKRHIADYVEFIRFCMDQYPGSVLFLESRVPTGVPESWGTADAGLVSPEHVRVIDLKYGQGFRVDAAENPQLRLYGVGFLETHGDVLGYVKDVSLTIFQPRLNNVSTEILLADELRAWRDSIIPVAEEALYSDNPRFGPSEAACRWCAVAGECRARMEKVTQEAFDVIPDLLTPGELGGLLERVPEIQRWCSDVQDTALRLAYSEGKDIPGWKVVMSGGRRVILDQPAALETLRKLKFSEDEVATTKLKGVGDLGKLAKANGYDSLEEVLGDLVVKTEGKPSLARAEDSRPPISPNGEAAKVFTEYTEPREVEGP
jgi:hypothetical protein